MTKVAGATAICLSLNLARFGTDVKTRGIYLKQDFEGKFLSLAERNAVH